MITQKIKFIQTGNLEFTRTKKLRKVRDICAAFYKNYSWSGKKANNYKTINPVNCRGSCFYSLLTFFISSKSGDFEQRRVSKHLSGI